MNSAYLNQSRYSCQFSIFVPNFHKKDIPDLTEKKLSTTMEFCIFKICLATESHYKQAALNSVIKYKDHERYIWSKTNKVNITIEFGIFESNYVPNFTLT